MTNSSEEKFFESLAKSHSTGNRRHLKAQSDDDSSEDAEVKITTRKNNEEENDGPEGRLTVDVYQTPSEIVVESAVAGIKPEDLDINVSNDSVSIKGERRRQEKIKEEDYLYQECYWGRFSRSVILPQEVDPENASVQFKNGILTIRLPKFNRKKTKKLKVKIE